MSELHSTDVYLRNPFGSLVSKPLDDQTDVFEINSEPFRACQRTVRDVSAGGFSAALTIFGDAGTGKTHLFGRVRRWLEEEPNTLFVFLRMETSPGGIWRHVRRNLALALLRTDSKGVRQIDALLQSRMTDLQMVPLRDLSTVLKNLLDGSHVRDSAAWLRGESLPDDVLHALHLPIPGFDDDAEVTSRQVVMAICDLIQPGVVVFCLDQIEAVMNSPTDNEGPLAFGKFVAAIVDETKNSAIICCMLSSFLYQLEQLFDNAVKSRLFGRRAAIRPLTWEQAERVISARLDCVTELQAPRASHAPCWPLSEAEIKTVFEAGLAPARTVIARCKDLFDLISSDRTTSEPKTEVTLEQTLQDLFDQRFAEKTIAETEAILTNGIPLLARSMKLQASNCGPRSPINFEIDNKRVEVSICDQPIGVSLASRLKKIAETQKRPGSRKLILLRDARLPAISKTAKVSQQAIADLKQHGAKWMTISAEAIAALAALRRLLSDAQSGDLAFRGETISGRDVENWIAGHMPAALDSLVSELRASEEQRPELTTALAWVLAERKLVSLEEAAVHLKAAIGEVEKCALADPRQFGLLKGSVPALFQPVIR